MSISQTNTNIMDNNTSNERENKTKVIKHVVFNSIIEYVDIESYKSVYNILEEQCERLNNLTIKSRCVSCGCTIL